MSGGTYRFRVIAVYSNNATRQSLHSAKVAISNAVMTSRPPLKPLPRPVVVEVRPLSLNELFIGWQVRLLELIIVCLISLLTHPFETASASGMQSVAKKGFSEQNNFAWEKLIHEYHNILIILLTFTINNFVIVLVSAYCNNFESLDRENLFLICGYILKGYGPSSYMKVIGSRLRSHMSKTAQTFPIPDNSRNVKLRSAIGLTSVL